MGGVVIVFNATFIFQLYRGGQFSWMEEIGENLSHINETLSHYVVSSIPTPELD